MRGGGGCYCVPACGEAQGRHRAGTGQAQGRHRAGTRPAPTGPGRWKRESTRDGGLGQAQGLPLPVRGGRRGSRRGTGGLGQAQGLPLPVWSGGRGSRRGTGNRGLELALDKGCDFLGKSYCFASLFFVRTYEIFQRIPHCCAVPAQSLGRRFQLPESGLTLRAFLCQIEQIMDEVETV